MQLPQVARRPQDRGRSPADPPPPFGPGSPGLRPPAYSPQLLGREAPEPSGPDWLAASQPKPRRRFAESGSGSAAEVRTGFRQPSANARAAPSPVPRRPGFRPAGCHVTGHSPMQNARAGTGPALSTFGFSASAQGPAGSRVLAAAAELRWGCQRACLTCRSSKRSWWQRARSSVRRRDLGQCGRRGSRAASERVNRRGRAA